MRLEGGIPKVVLFEREADTCLGVGICFRIHWRRRRLCNQYLAYSLNFVSVDYMIKHAAESYQEDAIFERIGEE